MHWFWKLLGYTSTKSPSDSQYSDKNGYTEDPDQYAKEHAANEKTQLKSKHEKDGRLNRIRKLMAKYGVGIYIVLEQDEHRSEYVADTDRRIRYVSNFPGSSAFVTIGLNWAELATDSRYYLIAKRQLSSDWTLRKLGLPGVLPWDEALVENARRLGLNVGVDPRFIDAAQARKLATALAEAGQRLIPIAENLVDSVWENEASPALRRPSLPQTRIFSLGLEHTGKIASKKVADLRKDMHTRGVRAYISASLEDNAWLLNLRGGDVPYVPIFKSFLVVTPDEIVLYVDKSKLPVELTRLEKTNDEYIHENVHLRIRDYARFFTDISNVKVTAPVWVPGGGSWAIERGLTHALRLKDKDPSSAIVADISAINLRKAIKNCAEIAGQREAQLKCSLSIVRYLAWLGEHIDENITEYDGGLKLLEFRNQLPDFMGNSFETISASGPNASAPHYAPEPVGSAVIDRNSVYLLDSGSQFLQGSTDITRTTHYGEPSEEEIRAYTLVLKGQLAVSSCVFPEGTSGFKLDILARQFLWEEGLDYGHGTGHGIGSFLNIHEMPLGIGMSAGPESILRPGHFVSDEPGFYSEDKFGVRLENDILVVTSPKSSELRAYYTFETLTLVPYEPRLIDTTRLTQKEKATINAYHQKCHEYIEPYLKEPREKAWLLRCTSPL